ncbi:MAG: HNH endonuclease [Bacteroides sp.]|nr:HNH endonuclease [Eubacterium sp.]MCM1418876.1 HNH endonuclease [Roseburia sp.]MCM1463341.1 HNH endonuclease [Bacteroides sp.]
MDILTKNSHIEIIFVVLIVVLAAWAIWFVRNEQKKKALLELSTLLKKLSELNSKYRFHFNLRESYEYQKSLPTKPKFDRYEVLEFFDECLLNGTGLLEISNAFLENRKLYREYSNEIKELKSEITEEQAKKLHLSYKKCQKIEQKLFLKQIRHPLLNCVIVFVVSYVSPQGRNHYSKSAKYPIDDVAPRYQELQKRIALQNSEEMRKKRARSQMTDKLRYTILKRDGFRCKLCGRTRDDGIQLEVDHIIPVAKGGKTVPENLRTLCKACNRGKRDEIEEIPTASIT